MGVIGGILIFVFGLGAGLAAAAGIAILIQRVMAQLKKENRHLKESAWKDRLEYETNRAYRVGYHRGYLKGRDDPMSDVERLASTIKKHNIDFRTGPAKKRGED